MCKSKVKTSKERKKREDSGLYTIVNNVSDQTSLKHPQFNQFIWTWKKRLRTVSQAALATESTMGAKYNGH